MESTRPNLSQSPDGLTFSPLKQWDVAGWYGQSLDNKPFIAVDNKDHVFITDPEGFRVIEYTTDGNWFKPGATTAQRHPRLGWRLGSQSTPGKYLGQRCRQQSYYEIRAAFKLLADIFSYDLAAR